jgi:hypothetical protein
MKISTRVLLLARLARLTPLAAISLFAGLVPTAHAAITSVSGSVVQIGAPVSCTPGALTGFLTSAWDEAQNVSYTNLPVDESQNPGSNAGAIAGLLNGPNDSHFLHFEPLPGAIGSSGTITFSGPISGIMFINNTLDLTDGNGVGTIYPTTFPFRGLNSASLVSYSGNTLQFNFATAVPNIDVVQVRVMTRSIPAPGAASLALAGGLIAFRRRR